MKIKDHNMFNGTFSFEGIDGGSIFEGVDFTNCDFIFSYVPVLFSNCVFFNCKQLDFNSNKMQEIKSFSLNDSELKNQIYIILSGCMFKGCKFKGCKIDKKNYTTINCIIKDD